MSTLDFFILRFFVAHTAYIILIYISHINYISSQYIKKNHLRNQKYKNKQLSNTWVLLVKNSPWELQKRFKQYKISINDIDEF